MSEFVFGKGFRLKLTNFFFFFFASVIAQPQNMPHFWIFMYRVSPFTYIVSALLSTGTANAALSCSDYEMLHFYPRANQTCGEYMRLFQEYSMAKMQDGGTLANPESTTICSYCALSKTNSYLSELGISYGDAWRNFGLMWAYLVFNVAAAIFIYWLARVPKGKRSTN